MKNSKKYKVIGIMSGTSVDGVDFAYLETNGIDFVKIIKEISYKYKEKYKITIKKFIKKINKNNSLSTRKIDTIISKEFLNKTNKFIEDFKINKTKVDYIGFSGQTILHKPNKKISIQLGSGKFLANKLKINVVSNFREKDINNGGQGAPIAAFYNKYLTNKINKNVAFVNIGGVSNVCYSNRNKIFAFDLGPGNALIDDFVLKRFNKKFDAKGRISEKGSLNNKILKLFLKNKYFKEKIPKSLDRESFNSFIKKVSKLTKNNAVHTLSMMTVYSIKLGLDLLKRNNAIIDFVILTGGGRKNLFILDKLKKLTNISVVNIDDLGFNGDLLESEAFGYLAIRSIKKLPISSPTTTGVKKPITGGILNKFK